MTHSDLSSYRIICDVNATPYLLGAAKWLSEKLGCQNNSQKSIVVSTCKCVVGWRVDVCDNVISICGENESMTVNAIYDFCQTLAPCQNDGKEYRKNGWSIAAPAFDGGDLCEVIYNDGGSFTSKYYGFTSSK